MMTCPRRTLPGPWNGDPGKDEWLADGRFLRCSFCGSLPAEVFFALVRNGKPVTPTDKDYKVYIDGAKLYFWHLSFEERQTFVELHNDETMKLDYPGHFYVRPYFAQPEAE